jgi:hypothetical protein
MLTTGLTLDSQDDIDKIAISLKGLSWRPTVRIVCDVPDPASSYKRSIDALSKVSEVIIQISDSAYSKKLSVAQFEARTLEYIKAFPQVNIIETSNEINMCDDCSPDKHSKLFSEQATAAMRVAKKYGKKTFITPYWNLPDCVDANGEYKAWLKKYLSDEVKKGADYVGLSVYGMDCEGRPEPTYAELDKELDELQKIFPNSKVMIGEYGADKSREKKYKIKNSDIIRHYKNYHRVGAGLQWYGWQMVNEQGADWQEFKK